MNAPIINTEALEAGPAAVPAAAKHSSSTSTADPQPKPRQARGLLGTDSRGHHYDRRWRQERFGRYRRYDRSTLSPWLAPVNTYSSVRRQPLPVLTGVLSSLLSPGNPKATAQSLAKAYSGGNSEAAAQAVASAAAGEGSTQATTVAQALTETAVSHPNVAPGEGGWFLSLCALLLLIEPDATHAEPMQACRMEVSVQPGQPASLPQWVM